MRALTLYHSNTHKYWNWGIHQHFRRKLLLIQYQTKRKSPGVAGRTILTLLSDSTDDSEGRKKLQRSQVQPSLKNESTEHHPQKLNPSFNWYRPSDRLRAFSQRGKGRNQCRNLKLFNCHSMSHQNRKHLKHSSSVFP